MATFQERLDEFKKAFESGTPPYNAPHEAIEKMHRATAELKASGIEKTALKVGDRAPAFSLFNQDHAQVSSSELLREGPLVVSFFRGHWWPYCNMELEALQEIHSEVSALGAQIVVLTAELERYTRKLHKKLNLTFDILTDFHLKVAEQFQLVFTLPDYLRDLYKSFGNALDRFHDELGYRLPVPARYIIDSKGIIRAADVNADYTIRTDPSETLKVLRTVEPWRFGERHLSIGSAFFRMSDGFASIRSIKAGRVTEGVSFFQPDDKFDPCVVGLCGLKEVAFCRDKIEMTLFRLGL